MPVGNLTQILRNYLVSQIRVIMYLFNAWSPL